MDEELTNREEELEAGEVGKPSFFYRQFLRNKGTSRDTLKLVRVNPIDLIDLTP
ncbi:hypothetical protein L249_5674 [Ophiocordyceps polyrhachis-furcata BCC 54312]|uniref:Uncharacterized protein n=1 Tax=Ophiocordyceps polyrhachis-furcata BCC 54312 TaxID=1330021 RepID=A0A367KZW1_9HYPO|nr:hypothetical protein L249_5674 [Ophiocordyceps polyrhachis-furcata BCC 54312]